MFNLPPGNAVDSETDLSVGQNQMPFETGVISHYNLGQKLPARIAWCMEVGSLDGWRNQKQSKHSSQAMPPKPDYWNCQMAMI